MAKLRQIAQLGHSVLRDKTEIVTDINNPEIQNLIDDMLITVKDVNGVGIAANQVYESYKIFIIASHPNVRYPDAPLIEPFALINPEIISHSEEKVKSWEGCLSVPGIRGLVPRYKSIKVKYLDREGKEHITEFHDFIARIFQHEYDHISGMVYLDCLENNKEIFSEKEFYKLISN